MNNPMAPKRHRHSIVVLALYGIGLLLCVVGIIDYAARRDYEKAAAAFFTALYVLGLLLQKPNPELPDRRRTLAELDRENRLRKLANVMARVANKKSAASNRKG